MATTMSLNATHRSVSMANRPTLRSRTVAWQALSNEDLLAMSRNGNSDAAHYLIGRYQYIIDNTARRLCRSAHDASDVASEIYLRVFEVINTCRNAETLPGWIKRIAINVFNGRYRRERRHNNVSIDHLTEVAGDSWQPMDEAMETQPLARLESSERSRRVRSAVLSLSETHKEIFDLFYTQNRSYEEIAAMTGLSLGTVKSRLFRAREALQRKLGDLVA